MTPRLASAILALAATPACAHRLDEYLQGTILSVEKTRVHAEMTLTPGVVVFPFLIAGIDTNGNGVISEQEQRAYAARVLSDLSFAIDGARVTMRLSSMRFPTVDEMKEGQGEIQLAFDADLPRGGRDRKLTFENRHQSRIAAYLVNCLVPRDPDIRITAQTRNYSQSVYQLEYQDTGVAAAPSFLVWMSPIGLLLLARITFLWRRRGLPLHSPS